MICAELRVRFDAYAGGTLSDPESAALESHLDGCPTCQEALVLHEGPLAAVAGLPRSSAPSTDLWPGIERELVSRRRLRGRVAVSARVLAVAAALLVAVSSGATVLLLRNRPIAVTLVQQSAGLSAIESQYDAASIELTRALADARGSLAPETVASIERSLRIIDAALAETREALTRDPGNQALGRLVVAAWRQKVDLLRRATALTRAG